LLDVSPRQLEDARRIRTKTSNRCNIHERVDETSSGQGWI
jgi:hypothetical protein